MIIFLLIINVFFLSNGFSSDKLSVPTKSGTNSNYFGQNYNLNLFPRLALVSPIFTTTAYSDASFYFYYSHLNYDPKNYLSKPLVNLSKSTIVPVTLKIHLISNGYKADKISVISDITVHDNNLYNSNGKRLYDTLVFFHNEYISGPEYDNILQFIAAGGNVIITDANAFFAEVNYNQSTNYLTLVSGHSFEFDGNATNSVPFFHFYGFFSNNRDLKDTGSIECNYESGNFTGGSFHLDPLNPNPVSLDMTNRGYQLIAKSYWPHEDNCLTTPNTNVIVDWHTDAKGTARGFKLYEIFPMGPLGGSLVHFGIYSSDIFQSDPSIIQTFIDIARYQMGFFTSPFIRYPAQGGVYNDKDIIIDFTPNWDHKVYLNGSDLGSIPSKSNLGYLQEGTYNLTIVFNLLFKKITRTVLFSIDRTPPQIIYNYNNQASQNVQIKINDAHAEMFTYNSFSDNFLTSNSTKNPSSAVYAIKTNEKLLEQNITINADKSKSLLEVKAFDSAGNENQSIFYVNSTHNPPFIYPDVKVSQLNETTVKLSVNKIDLNLTPYLLVTSDFKVSSTLNNWHRVNFSNFDTNTNEWYVYINKSESSYFLYKLYVTNGTFTKYIPFLHSFYWNNVITVKLDNLQQAISTGKPALLRVSNVFTTPQNGKILVINADFNQTTQISTFNQNQLNYTLTANLNNSITGHYIIRTIFTTSSGSKIEFNFPFIIQNNNSQTFKQMLLQKVDLNPFLEKNQTTLNLTIENPPATNFYILSNNINITSIFSEGSNLSITLGNISSDNVSIIFYDAVNNVFYQYSFLLIHQTMSAISSGSTSNISQKIMALVVIIVLSIPLAVWVKKRKK